MKKYLPLVIAFIVMTAVLSAVVYAEDVDFMAGVADIGKVSIADCQESGFIYTAQIVIISEGYFDPAPGAKIVDCITKEGWSGDYELFNKYICSKKGVNKFLIAGTEAIKCNKISYRQLSERSGCVIRRAR